MPIDEDYEEYENLGEYEELPEETSDKEDGLGLDIS